MYRRLLGSIVLALTLAVGYQVTTAARPLFVVCVLPDDSELLIVVESFGSVGDALQQCIQFWNGRPRGTGN